MAINKETLSVQTIVRKAIHEKLSNFNLEQHKGWGEKAIFNLLNSINSKRSINLSKFIASLGIEYIGSGMARLLASHYESYENWYAAMIKLPNMKRPSEYSIYKRDDGITVHNYSFQDTRLIQIDGIGYIMTDALKEHFSNEENIKMIEDLASVLTILPVSAITTDSIFSGKTVVFTGTLSKMERKEAQTEVENLGAKVCAQVSPHTDFLIVGKNPGSKYNKAVELGITILSEGEFFKVIDKRRC